MRVAVTGSRGLLGEALLDEAARRGVECIPLERSLIWVSDRADFRRAIDGITHVIHAAANTNVEECERQPDACYRDNLLLTERLLQRCAGVKCHITYVSSTGVYGGLRPDAHREYDRADPPTHHHRSKYLSEQAVQAASASNLVVRMGWLFGGRPENPKNFVARRIDEARRCLDQGQSMRSNFEQFGTPSYTVDMAERIWDLLLEGHRGIFNCVNSGAASRWEYVTKIMDLAGIPVAVEKISASSFNRLANVSNNEMALNWKAESLGLPAMRPWDIALKDYLAAMSLEAIHEKS